MSNWLFGIFSGEESEVPYPCINSFNGLEAVTSGSNCLKLPAAAFLGFAKIFFPDSFEDSFIFLNSKDSIKTSPLTSKELGIFAISSFLINSNGTEGNVLILWVMSSPIVPSPRVAAFSKTPFL